MIPVSLPQPPIGVIDSGVGGLSVLMELDILFSGTQFHYIADSSWCPYGNKSPDKISQRVCDLTDHLLALGCGSIVIACNSATISAVETLRTIYPTPFTGMEPAVKPAAQVTQSGTIGVLATEASLAGERFHKLVTTHGKDIQVITTACPKFVELVEEGITVGPAVDAAITEYSSAMLEKGADVLVLGCTHYPFLRASIQRSVGDTVQLIDTGAAVAKRTLKLYQEAYGELQSKDQNILSIETSGDLDMLNHIFPLLCPELRAETKQLHLK